MFVCLAMGTVVGMSLVGMGCGSTPMRPVELDQARMAYAQAQGDPQVASHAPVALREADQAYQQVRLIMTTQTTQVQQELAPPKAKAKASHRGRAVR